MVDLIKWWIFFEIVGWVGFPICYKLFKNQFDKGYTFSKILALLLWGYIFWLGNTFAIIGNTQAGAIFAFSIVVFGSILFSFKKTHLSEVGFWIKTNKKTIIFSEILFILSILFITLLRGGNPEIIGTEKPMELTFINGILKSSSFPPNDTWLSGYSISYYYFGYLIIAAIIKVIGTGSGVAFNLALIFWFALISIGSFGILLDLLVENIKNKEEKFLGKRLNKILVLSLIAPLLILIVSNGEGMLELLHSRGLFWKNIPGGFIESPFWRWLDIKELSDPPSLPYDWLLNRSGGTWWWRASRVLQDYTMQGQSREIIDEFPFFSFFLGDLHPHVLAMPVVLLCIFSGYSFLTNIFEISTSLTKNLLSFWKNGFNWFFAFSLGSLIFMNTWDFPIYFSLTAVIFFIKLFRKDVPIRQTLINFFSILFTFCVICILMYLPFLLGFSSQAGGILPSLIYQSRSIHIFIMFLPFSIVIMFYLIFRYGTKLPVLQTVKNWIIVFIGYLCLLSISFLIPAILGFIPKYYSLLQDFSIRDYEIRIQQNSQRFISFLSIYEADESYQLISTAISKILSDPLDLVILITLISIILSICVTYLLNKPVANKNIKINKQDLFIGILLFIGLGLILFPELFYLRDQFGWRMNTVFKFYFQAWILLSLSTAYAIVYICEIKKGAIKTGIITICAIGMISGLIYPYFAIKERINSLDGKSIVLDGNKYLSASNPNEIEAINFLDKVEYAIVTEAIGGSYSGYGRVSKLSGLPTILGWPGHERQWRGGAEEIGTRESDIQELYSTDNWIDAEGILEKYNIRYIYVGDLERTTYKISQEKFEINLPNIFINESVNIYEYQLEK